MQTKFKVNYKNRELGPLTEAQIRKMIENKQLTLTDKYLDDEKSEWLPLNLRFGEASASPPPVPAPVAAKAEPPKVEQTKAEQPKPKEPPRILREEVKAPTPPAVEIMEMDEKTILLEVPLPETTVMASAPAGKIQLAGGVGTLSFKHMKAGAVSLKLKSMSGLDLPKEINMTVQSGPASQVKMQVADECKAGEELKVELTAYDSFENQSQSFQGSLEIQLTGQSTETSTAKFQNGKSSVIFRPTRAEALNLQVKGGPSNITLPSQKAIRIQPNVPVKLTAEAPQEVQAGDDIALKIIALDAFGNVVTDFKGEIELEVETSTVSKAG